MSSDATHDFIVLTKDTAVKEKMSKVDLAAWIVLAKKRHKKGYLSQFFDIRRLRDEIGRLTAFEYYTYQLYGKERAAQNEFVGYKTRLEIYKKANDPAMLAIEECKIATGQRLAEHGLPAPETYALYRATGGFEGLRHLAGKDELAAFLRSEVRYPFFSKPRAGQISLGVVAADAYDAAGDSLILSSGKRVPVDSFVDAVSHFFKPGYLFQERLQPHPEVEKVCGHRLSSVRVMTLYEDGGTPELLSTTWKIPVGDNIADNAWRDGNMLAAVDPETGEVVRAIRGAGIDEHEVEAHPDTGERIKGMQLPDWDRMKELCRACTVAFKGMRLQAWDIAMTARGPVPLEINSAGDFSIPQRAGGSGILRGRFQEFAQRYL